MIAGIYKKARKKKKKSISKKGLLREKLRSTV